MKKFICIICDGISDRPIHALGNKTPLEAAHTPNLDKIAGDGISGMMHTVDIGVRPGSDTAHLSLFGYDPYTYYSGRGPFECAGIGMDVRPGDVCLRVNAGTLDESENVIDRRAGRIESTQAIADFLGDINIDGVSCILQPSLGHRMGLILRGKNLSHKVSDQDPHKPYKTPLLQVKPLDTTKEAEHTADILNTFSNIVKKKLKNFPYNKEREKNGMLPANILLFRGAGLMNENFISFKEKYGLHAAFVAGAPLYKGIAKVLGMDIIEFHSDDGVTGKTNSNLQKKIQRAIDELKNHDCVFVHIKAADTLAEDGNFMGKKEFIEKIDAALKPLAENNEHIVVITADHTTSSQLKIHTADPVPITIKGEGVRTDDINAFSERECAKGRLGHINGQNLMPILIDLMGLSEMYGA